MRAGAYIGNSVVAFPFHIRVDHTSWLEKAQTICPSVSVSLLGGSHPSAATDKRTDGSCADPRTAPTHHTRATASHRRGADTGWASGSAPTAATSTAPAASSSPSRPSAGAYARCASTRARACARARSRAPVSAGLPVAQAFSRPPHRGGRGAARARIQN